MEKFAKSGSIKLTKRLFVPAETGKKSEVVEGVGLFPLFLECLGKPSPTWLCLPFLHH